MLTPTPDRLHTLIAERLGVTDFAWDRPLADLGADSLDRVELASAIEDAFGVTVPEGSEFDWNTAGDLLAVVGP